jgi:hypothetical protein
MKYTSCFIGQAFNWDETHSTFHRGFTENSEANFAGEFSSSYASASWLFPSAYPKTPVLECSLEKIRFVNIVDYLISIRLSFNKRR